MPAKHSSRPFNTARMIMSFAVAILVLLVVWVAVRAVGPAEASRQPTVALPSMPQVAVQPTVTPSSLFPSPVLAVSSAVSSSPTPSTVVSSSASPSPRRTISAPVPETTLKPTVKPSPTTARPTTTAPPPPAAAASFAATVSVTGSWQFGYTGRVRIENKGNAARDWRITVDHSGLDNLRLFSWGVRGSTDGQNIVFTGGTLKPGASVSFTYQVTKTGRGNARPSGCSVVGGTCHVS